MPVAGLGNPAFVLAFPGAVFAGDEAQKAGHLAGIAEPRDIIEDGDKGGYAVVATGQSNT